MAKKKEQLDTTIEIVTPENIAFEYRVAGPFRRAPAFLIDLCVRGGIFMMIVFAATFLFSFFAIGLAGVGAGIVLVSWFFLDWFYGGISEAYFNGMTVGKWLMGIRVLTSSGQPISALQAIMRNVLRYVDIFPVLSLEIFGSETPAYVIPTFFVGLVVMAANRRYQRIGDLVCDTMVVIEERHWLSGIAKLEDPRAAQLATYLPPDFQVSRNLARALAAYVDRRRYFTKGRRRQVARYLAEPLLVQFGLPADTSYDLLLCALYYRTFVKEEQEADASPVPAPVAQQVSTPTVNINV